MIAIDPGDLRAIVAAAEASYPEEACGLLVGRWLGADRCRVRRAVASANLAPEPATAFEIDPALRLDLQRRLRGGPDRVVGLYHSHPERPAQPSARDLERAWEPEQVWLITSVLAGEAVLTTAHVIAREGGRQAFPRAAAAHQRLGAGAGARRRPGAGPRRARALGGERRAVNFGSDNIAGVAPEIMAAIAAANTGAAEPYGHDAVSARLDAAFSDLFEAAVRVFPVATGTAANALALATLCPALRRGLLPS